VVNPVQTDQENPEHIETPLSSLLQEHLMGVLSSVGNIGEYEEVVEV
jgi:hypothetical protein